MLTRKQSDGAAARYPSIICRKACRAACAALLTAAVGGCTLSDSLIPPNPIPEARPSDAANYGQDATPFEPSTGEGRMAAVAAASGPVEAGGPLPPPAPSAGEPASAPPYRTAAAGGHAASFPAAGHARRAPLKGSAAPPPGEGQPQPAAATVVARRAPQRETATVRFTPVIGAPVSAIRPLSEQLEKSARAHDVVIRNTADEPVDNILRGYFSASRRGSHTELVYMWDILDSSGTQLHRIQGTVTTRGGSGKVWDTIPDATMKDIARKTISAYLAWKARQAG